MLCTCLKKRHKEHDDRMVCHFVQVNYKIATDCVYDLNNNERKREYCLHSLLDIETK